MAIGSQVRRTNGGMNILTLLSSGITFESNEQSLRMVRRIQVRNLCVAH